MATDWRERAIGLEQEVDDLKSVVARNRSESANIGAELVALRSLVENERRKKDELGSRKGSFGKKLSLDGDRTMEVIALETQLVTTKVGLAQARFERDSLLSEVRMLRDKLAVVVPSSAKQIQMLTHRLTHAQDEGMVVEAAMRVGSVYQVGLLDAVPGALQFHPAFRNALRRKEVLEVQVTPYDRCYIEDEFTPDGALAQLLSTLNIGGDKDDQHTLMGFRSSMEIIKMHLKPRLQSEDMMPGSKKSLRSLSNTLLGKVSSPRPKVSVHVSSDGVPTAAPSQLAAEPLDEHLKADDVPVKPTAPPIQRTSQLKFSRKMSNPSEILEESVCAELVRAMPARYRMSDWQLLYSTSMHGFSLQTFYALCNKASPTLLAIRDSKDNVFGCYAPVAWNTTVHRYYGSGETFLYTAQPQFGVYRWTHANSFFQLSSLDNLAVGGGGHFGLWIDSEFYTGTSGRSETFDNDPLSSSGDFRCMSLEAWTFVSRSQLRDATPRRK